MRSQPIFAAMACASLAAACTSTEPPELEYADISGTYAGAITDTNATEHFAGTVRVTLSQSGENLHGTYELDGSLTGPYGQLLVDQVGGVLGVIAFPGDRSIVTFSFYSPECEDHGSTVNGGSDAPGEYLWLSGGAVVACAGVFSHPINFRGDSLPSE